MHSEPYINYYVIYNLLLARVHLILASLLLCVLDYQTIIEKKTSTSSFVLEWRAANRMLQTCRHVRWTSRTVFSSVPSTQWNNDARKKLFVLGKNYSYVIHEQSGENKNWRLQYCLYGNEQRCAKCNYNNSGTRSFLCCNELGNECGSSAFLRASFFYCVDCTELKTVLLVYLTCLQVL